MTEHIDFGATFGKATAPSIFGEVLAIRAERQHDRDADQQKTMFQANEKRRADNSKYLEDVANDKDYLTGDPNFDPMIVDGKKKLIAAGTDYLMKNPNVDKAQLMQFLSPYVNKMAGYKTKAQELNAGIKIAVDENKGIKGVNADAIPSLVRRQFLEDMKSKGIDGVKTDPESIRSIVTSNDKKLVVNDEGVTSVLDAQGKGKVNKLVKTKDASGRMVSTEKSYMLPTFADIGEDGQPTVLHESFSLNTPPSQQTTTVNGRQLNSNEKIAAQVYLRDVMSENGNIKLMDEAKFGELMKNQSFARNINASTQAYIDDYEKTNGEKFPRGSASEQMLQRALAFNKASQYLDSQVVDKQQSSQPVIINNGSRDKEEEKTEPTIEVYQSLIDKTSKYPNNMYPLNGPYGFTATEKNRVLSVVREYTGEKDLKPENVRLKNDGKGNLIVYRNSGKPGEKSTELFILDQAAIDVGKQTGAKANRQVAENVENNKTFPAGTVVTDAKGNKVKLKRPVSLAELKNSGFTPAK